MLLLTYLLVEYVPLVFEGLGVPLSCSRGGKVFFSLQLQDNGWGGKVWVQGVVAWLNNT